MRIIIFWDLWHLPDLQYTVSCLNIGTWVTRCALLIFISLFQWNYHPDWSVSKMEPACRKDKQKQHTPTRGDRTRQKSAQQELKQRQRAEVTLCTDHTFRNICFLCSWKSFWKHRVLPNCVIPLLFRCYRDVVKRRW